MKKIPSSSDGTYDVNTLIGVMTGKRDTGFYDGMAKVWARVDNVEVVDEELILVAVTFDGTNFATISIYWEGSGYSNYKTLGLYGQMSTQYQRVKFNAPRGLEIAGDSYTVRFQFVPPEA